MVHESNVSKRFGFNAGFPTSNQSVTQPYAASNTSCVMIFPINDKIPSPELGKVYSIKTRDVETNVVSMEIFYSKENPVSAQ